MRKDDYELIVAGGSFAGLTCAQSAAQRGIKTMVLERKPWPGTRVQTTGIIVKELAEQWTVPSRYCRRIEGVRVYAPSLHYLDLESPDYYFLATDTAALLRWQVHQTIQAGAAISFSSAYRWAARLRESWIVNGRWRTRFLAACDGARSSVARDLELGRNRQFLFGVEAEFAELPGLSDRHLHVFLDSDLMRGYIGWIVPGVNLVQIGLATRGLQRPDLSGFLNKISRLYPLGGRKPIGYRAGLIPCGGVVKPTYCSAAMLLGDAAGMVSPLTAGGIHPAVQLGILGGESIANYLHDSGPEPGRVVERHAPAFLYKRGLRVIFDNLPLPNRIYDSLLDTSVFRMFAQALFFHHRGLLSAAVWRDFWRMLHSY
jgi:digeranylgeranylglycerophospholipid reductase